MDLITELESEFSTLAHNHPTTQLSVRLAQETVSLRFPELGVDYLSGFHQGRLWVIPVGSISEVYGSSLPEQKPVLLEEFLTSQRTPIRVRYRTKDSLGSCWLLNVQAAWLRVSLSKGISWMPLAAISHLEIVAVDN